LLPARINQHTFNELDTDTQICEDGYTQGLSKKKQNWTLYDTQFMKIDVLEVCQRHKCDFHMQIGHANIWITVRAKE
jgi:hypothetical protein